MYVQHHYARIIGLSAVGIFVVLLLKHFNIGDHSYHLWLNLTTAESAKQNAFWLPDMSMSVEAHKIGGISDNLSGITYVKESDSFYVVLNRPPTILELDRRYEVVRQARLAGFGDSEGIAYAGNNKLLVLDERAQSWSILPLNGWGDALEKADHPSFTLARYDETNSGFEGIAVDRATQTVYVARENSPRKLLKISGLLDETQFVNVTRVASRGE